MRFLIDEVFGPDVAKRLRGRGHDAVHVADLGLRAVPDPELLAVAIAQARVVVTENAADFVPLLDARIAAGAEVTPVVVALKRNLPRGSTAMTNALATKLAAWAETATDAYRHVHWLG